MVKIIFILVLFGQGFITQAQNKCDDTTFIFGDPEELPVFNKQNPGIEGIFLFIRKNIKYPETAIEDKIEGKVFVQFWIDTAGNTSDHKIVKGVREDLNNEALRIAKLMKFDEPAKSSGKRIGWCYSFSVVFSLPEEIKHDVELIAFFSRDSVLKNDTLQLYLYFQNNSNEILELYPKGFICMQHDVNMFVTYESTERMIYKLNSVYNYDSIVFLNPQEVFRCTFSMKADTNFFYVGENNVFIFYRGKSLEIRKKRKKEKEELMLMSSGLRIIVYPTE